MTMIKLDEFTSLFVCKDVLDTFKKLSDDELSDVFSELLFFDKYGTHTAFYSVEYLKGEDYKKIFEIKIKLKSNREFRILAVRCSKGKSPADFLLLHAFFKKSRKITDQQKKKAYKVMKNECPSI